MPETEEEFVPTDRMKLRRRFPWLLMLDTARVAIDPRKLILAAAGVVVLALLNTGIDRLPFESGNAVPVVPIEIAAAQGIAPDQVTQLGVSPLAIKPLADARRVAQAVGGVPATGLRLEEKVTATDLIAGPVAKATGTILQPAADVNRK